MNPALRDKLFRLIVEMSTADEAVLMLVALILGLAGAAMFMFFLDQLGW